MPDELEPELSHGYPVVPRCAGSSFPGKHQGARCIFAVLPWSVQRKLSTDARDRARPLGAPGWGAMKKRAASWRRASPPEMEWAATPIGRLRLSPAYWVSAGGLKAAFRRAGSIAILTASSNRSNSTSVIALSESESAGILTVRIAIVPQITDAPLQVMIESF